MADDETEVLWNPGDVAKRLGVSASGLRRLAGSYAELYGELPRDSSGTSRLWSTEAVNRLEAARALLAAGRARSIKDALLAIEGGAVPSEDAVLALGQDWRVVEALGVVAARLEALQESNRELQAEVEALRGELRARDQIGRSLLPSPRGYSSARDSAGSERAAGADDGIDDQESSQKRDDGLAVRVARWLERILGRS
jgi:DNA-binding transcriptional MerR regulator